MTNKTYATESEIETLAAAAEFASTLSGGEVIHLRGPLGAGKTTFVRGAARALGFTDPVRSPTFTLVNHYPVDAGAIQSILHVDLYRIDSPSELTPLALEEDLGRPDTVTFIEWPERAADTLPPPTIHIDITIKDTTHKIHVTR